MRVVSFLEFKTKSLLKTRFVQRLKKLLKNGRQPVNISNLASKQ